MKILFFSRDLFFYWHWCHNVYRINYHQANSKGQHCSYKDTYKDSIIYNQKVFCSASSVLNSGVLTLNGAADSVIVIQAGSTLTMGSSASVVLTGGLLPSNVFWQVGSSATLGSSSVFKGTIAALSSITMTTGATMVGRALAQNAAVTFDTNTINLP